MLVPLAARAVKEPEPNGRHAERGAADECREILGAERQTDLFTSLIQDRFAFTKLAGICRIVMAERMEKLVQERESFIEGRAHARWCVNSQKICEIQPDPPDAIVLVRGIVDVLHPFDLSEVDRGRVRVIFQYENVAGSERILQDSSC